MNKKILSALALSTTFLTNVYGTGCQLNSGVYIGLGVGIAHLAGKINTDVNIQIGRPGAAYTNKAPAGLSETSATGSIFAGYAMSYNNFYGAAELYYQIDQLNYKKDLVLTNPAVSFPIQAKSNGAWGGNLHIGCVINKNCALYAIAGIEVRRFKVSFTNSGANALIVAPSFSKGYNSVAFTPGIGVRISVGKNWSLRTEYKYAMHSNKTFSESKANPGGGTDTGEVRLKPHIHSINIGLVYNF